MSVVRWLRLCLCIAGFLAACSSIPGGDGEDPVGSLRLPLQSQAASGIAYRLVNAAFTVVSKASGEVRELVVKDDAGQQVRLTLPVGAYGVELRPLGQTFQMLRVDDDGSTASARNVELTSASSVEVLVREGLESTARFGFLVDGLQVGFGGDLLIVVEVTPRGRVNDSGADGPATDAGTGGSSDASAAAPRCGDGVVNQSSEDCDDGNLVDTDGCSNGCVIACVCGDLVLCPAEQCDDGNLVSGDGCSDQCVTEAQGGL